jgi:hypothetical protein
MHLSIANITSEKALQVLCASVLAIILAAGLWPFHAPANQVRWIENESGLEFGRRASALSETAFLQRQRNDESCSLELWLTPGHARGARTILAFEGAEGRLSPFSIQEDGSVLRVRRHNVDKAGIVRTAVFDVTNAFEPQKAVFVTVTLDPGSTLVYLDGLLAKTEPIGGSSSDNFTGRLACLMSGRARLCITK